MLAYLYQGYDVARAQKVAFQLSRNDAPKVVADNSAKFLISKRRRGHVQVDSEIGEDLCCFLRLSEYYQLDHLKQWAESELSKLLSPENLIALSTHAYFCSASQLLRLSIYHLRRQYSELVGIEDWEDLDPAIKELVLADLGAVVKQVRWSRCLPKRTSIVSFGLGSVQGSNPEGGQVQVDGHQLLQKVQELHEFVEQSFRQQGKLLRELRRVRRREWMQDVEVPDSLQPLGPEPLNASEGTEEMDKEENNVEEGLHRSSSHEEAQATQTEEKAVEKEVEGLEPPELAEGSRSNEARTTQMSVQSILVSSNYPEIGERPEATASGFDVRGSQRSQLSTLSMPSSVGGGRHAVRLSNRTNRSTKSNRSGSRSWTTDQSSPDSFLQDEYSRLFTAAQVQANWMQRKRAASDVDLSQLEQRPTRQFAKQIVESRCFTYTLTFLILVHVVLMGLEVDAHAALGNDSVPEWFDIANLILVCIFVGELFMKLMALGFMNFWCGKDCGWNAFDFLVISFSVADVVLALTKRVSVSTAQVRVFRLLRIFRYFRSIRVVRLFRYISALRVLTLSILGTMSSFLWHFTVLEWFCM
eukprot:symbB.v1.2.041976.t1/scaffold8960.1/size4567/1